MAQPKYSRTLVGIQFPLSAGASPTFLLEAPRSRCRTWVRLSEVEVVPVGGGVRASAGGLSFFIPWDDWRSLLRSLPEPVSVASLGGLCRVHVRWGSAA